MIELTALANLIYAQTNDYQEDLSSIEYLIIQDEDPVQRERAYKALECCLREYGARTPTSEYLLKQLATEANRDIITTGNLLHLGSVIQPCTVSAPCTEDNDMGRKNILYMYEGKKYSTTGETFADAVENAIKKHCAAPAQNVSDAPLFQEYAEKWFEVYRRTLKPNSAKNNESMLKKHLYPYFGQMRIDEITLEVVQAFLT